MEKLWLKSYAKGIPPTINYEKTPMPQALSRTAAEFPDKTALVFIDSKISYRQLNDMANRFANALIAHGGKTGGQSRHAHAQYAAAGCRHVRRLESRGGGGDE